MERDRFVNERGAAAWVAAKHCEGVALGADARGEQPQAARQHRAADMSFFRALLIAVLASLPVSLAAQPAAPAPAASPVSSTIRPALGQVAQTLNSINVRRWKAPNPVRDAADGDVSSIQRDLNGTLAGLLQQADAAPASVPAAFAVYRNLDALYDTLLRVVETAELAAPDNEQSQLESALKTLENARNSLGDAIQNGSQTQQAELVRLRTVIATAAASQPSAVKTTVINDGPAPSTKPVHHHTTTKKPATSTTHPANTSQSPSNPQ